MINKTLVAIIAVLVLVGAVVVVLGKIGNKTNQPTGTTGQPSAPAQSTTSQGTGGTIPKETIVNVNLTSSGFDPKTVTVKAGTRVIWFNKSGDTATVNSDIHPTHQLYAPLNLGEFPDGSSVQLVFDKPSTYGYHDHLNPSRTGTVIVE